MEYLSVAKVGTGELEEKRSRFIGAIVPAFSADEAEEFVAFIRRKHPDASHNVFAYTIGTGTPQERLSDDGEPRGTAAYPILEVLKKRGLRNVACVVTRYFGGTLLGAGGLLRAYGKAASLAIENAGIVRYVFHQGITVLLEYDQLGRLKKELEARKAQSVSVIYGDKVTLTVYVRPEEVDALSARMRDLTAGKARPVIEEGKYIKWKTR